MSLLIYGLAWLRETRIPPSRAITMTDHSKMVFEHSSFESYFCYKLTLWASISDGLVPAVHLQE